MPKAVYRDVLDFGFCCARSGIQPLLAYLARVKFVAIFLDLEYLQLKVMKLVLTCHHVSDPTV